MFLHYPPLYQGYRCPEILRLLKEYGVKRCCYGHLHGATHRRAIEGKWDGTEFSPGLGGLSAVCSQKNLRLMQKMCGN